MLELANLPPPSPDGERIELVPAREGREAVWVRLAPIGPSTFRAAQAALVSQGHPVPEFADDAGFDAFCRELLRRSIIEWGGVTWEGAPAPLTVANIDALLGQTTPLATLQALFIGPYLERESEKNVSSPSSAGISAAKTGAPDTAAAAPRGAKRARMKSTPRAAGKAKASGAR